MSHDEPDAHPDPSLWRGSFLLVVALSGTHTPLQVDLAARRGRYTPANEHLALFLGKLYVFKLLHTLAVR